jgi:tRNA G18 (ribose-2'-O)-methylase SpoU
MLLNASYQPDLAERTAAWLQEQGFQVVGTGTTQATSVSTVDLQGPAPYGLCFLAETFGMTPGHIDHEFTPDAEMDLVLILGDDWANNNPMP